MTKTDYKITSEEGAARYGAEIGETVTLDIKDEEQAVIAAGWLEHVTKAPKEKE